MTTTPESAERLALRGLLLMLVEVQNVVRTDVDYRPFKLFEHIGNHSIASVDKLLELVDSDHAREMVQLARAVLGSVPAPSAIPADEAGVHA
jgi:hypothetical protein